MSSAPLFWMKKRFVIEPHRRIREPHPAWQTQSPLASQPIPGVAPLGALGSHCHQFMPVQASFRNVPVCVKLLPPIPILVTAASMVPL